VTARHCILPLERVEEVMTHDGQNPGAQAGPLSEEVAKAQSSLAGGLHQIHSFFRIASELVGVATENRELSYQISIEESFLLYFLVGQWRRSRGSDPTLKLQSEVDKAGPGPLAVIARQ
jgi:hypothetical protein